MTESLKATRAIEILLVEDSPTDRLIAIAALEQARLINSLNVVENGVDALAYLRREGRFADAKRPDLILLDLNLPRMDGREVLAQIKEDRYLRAIPVVVLTTSTASDDVARAYGRHVNGYITKPVDFARFGEALRTIGDYWFEVVTLPTRSAIERVTRTVRPERPVNARAPERSVRVLVLHPDRTAAAALERALGAAEGYVFDVVVVAGVVEAREALTAKRFDLALVAPSEVGRCAFDVFEDVLGAARGCPVAVIVADGAESLGMSALAKGAFDYLLVSECGTRSLVRTVRNALETKGLRDQLLLSQRMESLGQLAGGVAHDFNNILTVINANASLIASGSPDAEAVEFAEEVKDAAERGANLTRQLLSFGGRRAMDRTYFELNDVVGGFTRMLRRVLGERVRLQLQLGPDIHPILGDVAMIEQVLLNLIVNARDAMPDGGKITIKTEAVVLDAVRARTLHRDARVGGFARLTVRDTGIGIPQNLLERVFEPYFTTKKASKGSGLGLATVNSIVREHGGFIVIESALGRGTTFDVYFLTEKRAGVVTPLVSDMPYPHRGTETILLVDDEDTVRAATRRILTGRGYKVIESSTVEGAIAAFDVHGPSIALLLTDLVVSEGLTGRDLARHLRLRQPALKVVLSSGHGGGVALADLEPGETMTFLRKPYGAETLARVVGETLRGTPPNE